MNSTDRIVTALTPGSMFNRKGLVFRSVKSLAEFAGISEEDVLNILNGDLVAIVTCKPSGKGKGILVGLNEAIQAAQEAAAGPVAIQAMPGAPGAPLVAEAPEVEVDEAPLAEAPGH